MDKRLFFLLNAAQHRLFSYADSETEQRIDLTATQSAALMFIAKYEGCQQKEVAAGMSLKQSAVTGLISRMLKKGLVERSACELDGRAQRLFLSARGRAKLSEIFPLIEQLNSQLTQGFSAKEIDTVARFLHLLIDEF